MILLALVAAAFAPSFDCAKASTVVETLVCKDEQLARLDAGLAVAYRNLRKKDVSEQKAWLENRDACTDRGCLLERYETRLAFLLAGERTARHYRSRPNRGELHVLALGNDWYAFTALGLWPTPGGSVNIADASGSFRLDAAGVAVRRPTDEFDCGWRIQRFPKDIWQLTSVPVSESNGVGCYGWNATVDGVYRRVR
jgi:uncharacterized protein YecT (DUF1311 family)